ncbi:MAG: hypothetical protein HQL91_11815, partial [Magnetococcales bacterium]|nr:hypothetical protein [Magnetococcales bacterium]
FTGTIDHWLHKDLHWSASVYNLLNNQVIEPAAVNTPQDYPRPGRAWGLTVSYDY